MEDFEQKPVVSNSAEVDTLIKNIKEACLYLRVLETFGYNETSQKFLKSYETFNTVDFSELSKEDLVLQIQNTIVELNNQLDVAYEGWIKNMFARAAYAFKTDAGVAKKIGEKLDKIRNMSDESLGVVLNKKLGFKFYTPESLEVMMEYMEKAVQFAENNEKLLNDTRKSALTRKASKDEVKSILDKVRSECDDLTETYQEYRRKAMSAKGDFTDDKSIPSDNGWNKNTLVNVLSKWLQIGAGKLSKLKLIRNNTEKWGYDTKTRPGVGANSNGDYFLTLEFEAVAKEEFKQLIVFIDETLDLYDSIDSTLYRFVKKF